MLRGRALGILAGALATMALTPSLVAQTRVKLQRNVGVGVLQTAIAELTVPARLKAAQQRLWQAGEAAVPLLSAEVERAGAGEAAALFVLEQLGCEAAAAVPVLRRIVDDPQTGAGRRARVAATIAKIDGPPIILVPNFNSGEVIEFDLDGNERRRVKVESAWGAWPMPDDRIGVMSFGAGAVLATDWQGKQETLRKLEAFSGSVVPLGDDFFGDVAFTMWKDQGELIFRNAADEELRKLTIDALRVERDFGDELLVVTRAKPRVVWFSSRGEELRSVPLPEVCNNVQPLPGGGFLAAGQSNRFFEFAPDGTKTSETLVASAPNDVVRLRDGRTIVSMQNKLSMLRADGEQLWSAEVAYGGPLFVRHPAREGR